MEKFIEIKRNTFLADDGSVMLEGFSSSVNNELQQKTRIYMSCLNQGYTFSPLGVEQLLYLFGKEILRLEACPVLKTMQSSMNEDVSLAKR